MDCHFAWYHGNAWEEDIKATLDRFGRVVVPKEIRDRLGLSPGAEIEIAEKGDDVVLKPVACEIPVKMKDGVLVFTGGARGDLMEAVRLHRETRILQSSSRKRA